MTPHHFNSDTNLSLCMIVKNEEFFLKNCLSQAKPYCFEIIIIDTGSTDKTKNIAKECGAFVFDFEWLDDFSLARNFSLKQAKGDWILVLDADEFITPLDWQVLLKNLKNTNESYFDLCQVNYTNQQNMVGFKENHFLVDGFSQYKGYTVSWLTRVFKNNKNYLFQGAVHEHLSDKNTVLNGKQIPVYLHHHGQALSQDQQIKKKKLYLSIGEKKVKENPQDYKANHELGIAYWELGDINRAILYFEKSYEIAPKFCMNLIALGTVKQIQKDYLGAKKYLSMATNIEPLHSSAHAALGRVLFDLGDFDEAIQEYKKQIHINPDQAQTRFWLHQAYNEQRRQNPKTRPSLSLCYITKNEADCIEKALLNVKNHVNEIIVFDTGSIDETVSIAKKNGATVIKGSWRDDFSWARNQSLKYATSEWVLVLDADEVLGEQDWTDLKQLIQNTTQQEFYLVQTTYSNQSTIINWKPNDIQTPEAKGYNGYFESPLVRLFRNTPQIKFKGVVHEHAFHESDQVQPISTSIRIHHYGKSRDETRMKEKSDLYHKIGIKKIQDMPDESHVYYEMAIQLWEMDETSDVEKYLIKTLKLDPNHKDAGIAYACFLHSQKRLPDSIDQFVNVIKKNPENAEAHLYLSSVLIEAKKYDMALQMIEKARKLNYQNKVTLLMNEGVVYLNIEDFERAKECYLKAYQINSAFAPLLVNLALVCQKTKKYDDAMVYLNKVLSLDPDNFLAHKYLGEVFFNTGQLKKALDSFLKAFKIDSQSCAVVAQIIIAGHCLNQKNIVIEFEKKLCEFKNESGYNEICTRLFDLYNKQGDQDGLNRLKQLQ